jgi:hypothetical protein
MHNVRINGIVKATTAAPIINSPVAAAYIIYAIT